MFTKIPADFRGPGEELSCSRLPAIKQSLHDGTDAVVQNDADAVFLQSIAGGDVRKAFAINIAKLPVRHATTKDNNRLAIWSDHTVGKT